MVLADFSSNEHRGTRLSTRSRSPRTEVEAGNRGKTAVVAAGGQGKKYERNAREKKNALKLGSVEAAGDDDNLKQFKRFIA